MSATTAKQASIPSAGTVSDGEKQSTKPFTSVAGSVDAPPKDIGNARQDGTVAVVTAPVAAATSTLAGRIRDIEKKEMESKQQVSHILLDAFPDWYDYIE